MFDLDLFQSQYVDAQLKIHKLKTFDDWKLGIDSKNNFWVDGVQCYIWSDLITAVGGVPSDYMPGACFIPDFNCIVLNEFCAYKTPRPYLEAIIQHELGHRQYAHYSKERNVLDEYQADRYSHNKGCDISGALQYMMDIVNTDIQHVIFAPMVEELTDRINVLKALDK